jgi:pSer/pThr/pTyr-binding forkhead associated (FHA) protein
MQSDQILKVELAIKDKILKTYSFTKDIVNIGRIPTADIFIDNSGVSRQHTRIERSIGGPFIVKDMGSTNGTFLNNMQVNEAALKSNDVINLGKFSLRVTIESESDMQQNSGGVSADDFDGTTVLSAAQLAQLRAGIENDQPAAQRPAGGVQTASGAQGAGMSLSQLFLWGGVILAVGVIGFFIFK